MGSDDNSRRNKSLSFKLALNRKKVLTHFPLQLLYRPCSAQEKTKHWSFTIFFQPSDTKCMIKVGYHGKGTAVARIELQTTQAPGDCADHLTITNPMFIASQWKISSWNFQVLNFDSKRKKRPMHFECRQFQPRWEKNPA